MRYGESGWRTGTAIGGRLVIAGDHAVWSAPLATWQTHASKVRAVDLRDGRECIGPAHLRATPFVTRTEVVTASAAAPHVALVLDVATLEPIMRFDVGGEVSAIAADAHTIAAGVLEPATLVLIPRDGGPTKRATLPDAPRIAAFSPDGRSVAVGVGTEKSGGHVFVIDVATGRLLATLKGLRAAPTRLIVTATDVLACAGKTVLAWPVAGGKSRTLLKGAKQLALLFGVSPGGLAIVGSLEQTIQGVDPSSTELRWTREAYGPSALHEGRLVSCHFHRLDELDPETGEARASVSLPDHTGLLAIDATRTCTTGIVDSTISVVSAGATEWPRPAPQPHSSLVAAVSFHGDRFATVSGDGRDAVWRRGEPQPIARFVYRGAGSLESLACLLDGDTLVTAHGHRLQRWSIESGKRLAESPSLAWSARLIVSLPDLGQLFVATDPWRGALTHFVLLDALTLEIARDAKQARDYVPYAHARRVGPTRLRLGSSLDWTEVELPSCRVLAKGAFIGLGNVADLHHLTGDEKLVVRIDNLGPTFAERRGRIVVRLAADGTVVHELGSSIVWSAAMHPDGRLATLHEGLVRVWDVAAGRVIAEIPAVADPYTQVTWFPDGLTLLLRGPEGNLDELDVRAAR